MRSAVSAGAVPQLRSAARVLAVGIPLAVTAGLTLPLQARINGELGQRLQDPLLAGLFSFGGAALIMAAATLVLPSGRAAFVKLLSGTREGSIPWYFHAAGVVGAYFIFAQTSFVAGVGIAIYTVAVVTGQTVSGLAVDRVGLGPGGKRAITALRVIGVLLTVGAVFWAVSPRLSGVPDPAAMLVPLALVVLAGILMTFQHAVNGKIAAQVRSPIPGTLINYVVGSFGLALIWVLKLALTGGMPTLPAEPWLYTGGALGCINLVLSALLIRHIGVLLTGLSMIAGQLIGALLMDWLLPVAGSAIYPQTVFGTLLTLAAIVVAALPGSALRKFWQPGSGPLRSRQRRRP
ncbi:DMT family transporter [Pseudarthrobacter sp. SSS035]|uniref:DMT family transporter n=1 Tax=Pseudarthrobacter sp. SSS035 TaxID=2931399 RepID=UPI00200F3C05|nr:DMT family transporter [Pseudarthrobacter sp. SSS035]